MPVATMLPLWWQTNSLIHKQNGQRAAVWMAWQHNRDLAACLLTVWLIIVDLFN